MASRRMLVLVTVNQYDSDADALEELRSLTEMTLVESVDLVTRTPLIRAEGNPQDGFSFYGPFADSEDADPQRDTDDDWWLCDLKLPEVPEPIVPADVVAPQHEPEW